VAVVVATHRRAGLLERLVRALEAQVGAPAYEVVLVDDGSGDDTWPTIERLAASAQVPVRGVRMPDQSGPAAARNAGWRSSAAPLIAFTDDDCVPTRAWLRTLADALERVDIAQGATLPDPAQAHLLGPFARTMEVRSENGYYQTCNVSYRRATLEHVGGFDDELRQAGEDIELATRARRAGAATVFCPTAVVHHDVRPSNLRAHLRGTRRWAGIVLAVRKQPALRERLHYGFVWKRSHLPAVVAAAGLGLACSPRRGRQLVGAALAAPYVRHRLVVEPLPHAGPRRRFLLLPAALVADLDEVAVLAGASARYRTLVL
jgi:glycosyltransferase involved in cell wall biosynthesis